VTIEKEREESGVRRNSMVVWFNERRIRMAGPSRERKGPLAPISGKNFPKKGITGEEKRLGSGRTSWKG